MINNTNFQSWRKDDIKIGSEQPSCKLSQLSKEKKNKVKMSFTILKWRTMPIAYHKPKNWENMNGNKLRQWGRWQEFRKTLLMSPEAGVDCSHKGTYHRKDRSSTIWSHFPTANQ